MLYCVSIRNMRITPITEVAVTTPLGAVWTLTTGSGFA